MSRAVALAAALLLAGAWGAMLGLAHLRGAVPGLERAESALTDLRMQLRGTRPPPPSVAIVAIDDATAAQVGAFPLPRTRLADLVAAVAAARPRVIALDILLVDPGPPEGDAALAAALRRAPSVIGSAATFSAASIEAEADGALAGVAKADAVLQPAAGFREAASAGFVNVQTDVAGAPRAVPLFLRLDDRLEIALPLRAIMLATGEQPELDGDVLRLGSRRLAPDRGWMLPLNFYGPRTTIPTISAADLLDGKADAAILASRIVVVGSTVTGGGDIFPSPFDAVLPGVEVQATAVANLMGGDSLDRGRTVRIADAGVAVALPVMIVGLLAWRRTLAGLAGVLLIVAVWAALNMVAFVEGVWMSAALPLAAALPPAALYGALQMWQGRQSAARYQRQSEVLQQVQAPGLTQWLAQDPDLLAAPVQQDAAVLFVDLSGFTGLSERLGAAATRDLLDGFYQIVEAAAARSGGMIASFMGDGVMILFGLPKPRPDDPGRALSCAVDVAVKLQLWLDGLPDPDARPAGFKIGAHLGPVVASRLGRGQSQQIAATGDTVNVASRLMDVAAAHGAPLAVSRSLRDQASSAGPTLPGRFGAPMAAAIRGRDDTVDVCLWTPP